MRVLHTVATFALPLVLAAGRASGADVDFVKEIKPILEQSCTKCHGPEKPKGALRLDIKDGLLKGSKSGKVVVAGQADDSRLYEVITLPKDDPDHMPAEGDPLPQAQTDLIRDWINQGLKWPDGVTLQVPAAAKAAAPEVPTDPGLPITDAEKAAIAKVQKSEALAQRLAQNTNRLSVNFSLQHKNVKDDDLAPLKDMPNLVELNLGNTPITDAGLVHLKGLGDLTRLQLHKTKISDAGLENLKGLQKLTSLNLYGTEITDKGLEHLTGLKNLRKLYLWQTKVTEEGAKKLAEAVPGLVIDRGLDAVPPPPKPEPAKEEKK
jgi:hypothetical protein